MSDPLVPPEALDLPQEPPPQPAAVPAEIEALRESAMKVRHQSEASETVEFNRALDNLIDLLTINRGHIGGLAFVVVPVMGDCLIVRDANDGTDLTPSDSMSGCCCLGYQYRPAMSSHLRGLIRQVEAPRSESPSPVEQLLRSLRS